MLDVAVLEAGLVPRFRVTHDQKPARLLTIMVSPAGDQGPKEPIWALGPVGMRASLTTGIVTEMREGDLHELRQVEESADRELGEMTAEVLEVTYGVAPRGLHQVLPEGHSPPQLRVGQRYIVFAAGPFHMGIAEFTA